MLNVRHSPAVARRLQELALDAVRSVAIDIPGGGREIDVKKYAKVSGMRVQNAASIVVSMTTTGSCLVCQAVRLSM